MLAFGVPVAVVQVAALPDEGGEAGPTGRVDALRASPAAAVRLLDDLTDALTAQDTALVGRLAPVGDEVARTRLVGIADNARSLDLEEVGLRYVGQAGDVAADGSWTGVVELTWRLGVVDPRAATADVLARFVPDAGRLALEGFAPPTAGSGARLPLWLRGRLAVARASGAVVLVDGTQRRADAVARRVERGMAVVRRVLPRWSSPVVVEVPASARELDETLGAEPGTHADTAAVTAPAGSGAGRRAPVHVFVNPEVTSRMRDAGAQVVMSHELTHLATDATRARVPSWLREGFADHVALRDVGAPERVVLARAVRLLRSDGPPRRLPSDADLAARSEDLQAHYEEAWLASRVVVDRLGERGLVALYRSAAAGEPVAAALRRQGWSVSGLVAAWRARLRAVSGG